MVSKKLHLKIYQIGILSVASSTKHLEKLFLVYIEQEKLKIMASTSFDQNKLFCQTIFKIALTSLESCFTKKIASKLF
jgi:hypothetical protein